MRTQTTFPAIFKCALELQWHSISNGSWIWVSLNGHCHWKLSVTHSNSTTTGNWVTCDLWWHPQSCMPQVDIGQWRLHHAFKIHLKLAGSCIQQRMYKWDMSISKEMQGDNQTDANEYTKVAKWSTIQSQGWCTMLHVNMSITRYNLQTSFEFGFQQYEGPEQCSRVSFI